MTRRLWDEDTGQWLEFDVVWPLSVPAGLVTSRSVRGGSLLEDQGRERRESIWAAQSYPEPPTGVSAVIHRAAEVAPSDKWTGGSHNVLFVKHSAWRT